MYRNIVLAATINLPKCVRLSSTEDEYVELSEAAERHVRLPNLPSELCFEQGPTPVNQDNTGCIDSASGGAGKISKSASI